MNKALKQRLQELDSSYDAAACMLKHPCQSPGYHTQIADGTPVHSTVRALDYALLLLQSGEAERAERAAAVIRAVLALQECDPCAAPFGIWPWFYEEPLAAMSPPDYNWADFCGARLAEMLVGHAAALSAELIADMRAALQRAGMAIFRRNVGSHYTNIAVMGAGVCAVAGEILQDSFLLAYGCRRLERFIAYTREQGGFNEYNSPTYTIVVVEEAERILRLAKDETLRALAGELHEMAWECIATHFHPATGQWAGPHSRAYSDRLRPETSWRLAVATGCAIGGITPEEAAEQLVLKPLPCPEKYRHYFQDHDRHDCVVQQYNRREPSSHSTKGTTWFDGDVCLGSVNHDSMWVQRRPVIAYWKNGASNALLRLRFLHDGKDFASAFVRNAQSEGRLLSAVGMLSDQGDHHCHLDRPANGIFSAEDFRLRYELQAEGASVKELYDERFLLQAGERMAAVHCHAGRFDGQEVRWEAGVADGRAFVDAVCYQGVRRDFDFKQLADTWLFVAMELLYVGEFPSDLGFDAHPEEASAVAWSAWQNYGLSVAISRQPLPLGKAIATGS
jgi:hypothetical protein